MNIIYFNSKRVRNYLMKNSFVYTFRTRDKPIGDVIIMKNKNYKYGNGKITEKIKINNLKELKSYIKFSSFNDLDEWIKEIEILNRYLPESGWLYKVEIKRKSLFEIIEVIK